MHLINFIHQHGHTAVVCFIAIAFMNFFFGDLDADVAYHEREAEEDWMDNPVNPLSHNYERD